MWERSEEKWKGRGCIGYSCSLTLSNGTQNLYALMLPAFSACAREGALIPMRVAPGDRAKTDWEVACVWTTDLRKTLAWYLPLGCALCVPTFSSKLYGQSLLLL